MTVAIELTAQQERTVQEADRRLRFSRAGQMRATGGRLAALAAAAGSGRFPLVVNHLRIDVNCLPPH